MSLDFDLCHCLAAHEWRPLFAVWVSDTAGRPQLRVGGPPSGSTAACPRCLAGDRSDTDTHTCSSEEGGFSQVMTSLQPSNAHSHTHSTHTCQTASPLTSNTESGLQINVSRLAPISSPDSFGLAQTVQRFVQTARLPCLSSADPAVFSHAGGFGLRAKLKVCVAQ